MHGEIPYSVRIWRWLHSGRDPLVRTRDRLQALLLIFVLVGAVLLALPVDVSVGSEAYAGRAATTNSYPHSRSGRGRNASRSAAPDRPGAANLTPRSRTDGRGCPVLCKRPDARRTERNTHEDRGYRRYRSDRLEARDEARRGRPPGGSRLAEDRRQHAD